MHWIVDPRFRAAIGDYLRREGAHVDEYARDIDSHVPYRDARREARSNSNEQDHHLARAGRGPRVVSAARPGARRTGGPAGGRRRPVARAAAGGLPARHLSLVFGRPAGVVVVAESARSPAAARNSSCSRSLAKTLRNRGFEIDFDRDFAAVVDACAARREHSAGTWITPEMHAAYCELHARGHAHSVEVRLDGELVGGLYGVLLGSVFLRRIDVQPRARRLEGGPRPPRRTGSCCGTHNSSIASYLPLICARSGSKPMTRREFSALVRAENRRRLTYPCFRHA